MTGHPRVVAAFAGRRIDAAGAPPRFPASQEQIVRSRIEALFERRHVSVLVASAACGSDLLALEIAGRLAIRRIVLLPHDRDQFRTRSVVDRGETWGPRFERVLEDVEAQNDLTVLHLTGDEEGRYRATNEAVIGRTLQYASGSSGRWHARAIVVWDGRARDERDITGHFKRTAEARKLPIDEVSTL